MKVLWHSNGPHAPTGYGTQTALFARQLAAHHEVSISANYGLEAAPIVWNGIPVLPGLGGDHGNTTLPGHIAAMFDNPRDGLVFTLYDTPVFDSALFARYNVACWTPVDHEPIPPGVVAFFRGSQAIPVAMTRFGQEELAEFDPLYVPHGINTEAYRPSNGAEMREEMDIPADAFIVGMVAANKGRPSRKGFQQAFEAFRFFRERHENAYLYLHTVLSPDYASGEDLPALLDSLEIPEDVVRFPNQYSMVFSPLNSGQMASIYSAMDVLLNPSLGEGFGIPILEAQACGVPVIVTEFTAMTEVCGAGWKVKGRPYWTAQKSWQSIADVGHLVDALEECHDLSDEARKALSEEAIAHAAGYDARLVFEEHMLPAFAEIEERIGDRRPVELAA